MEFKILDNSSSQNNMEVSSDIRNFIYENPNDSAFDSKSIDIAKTLISDEHVSDGETGERTYSHHIYDNEPYTPYDVKGHAFKTESVSETTIEKMWEDLQKKFPPPKVPPVQIYSTNKSAVNLAKMLFNLGVERWYLPLHLSNPALDGLDPYDEENLTEEQKQAIFMECTANLIYYCREVVRIPADGAINGVQMFFHIGAFTSMFLSANDISYYLEQPRQTYKTGTDNAIVGWCWNFASRKAKMALYANNVTKAKDNLINVMDILELLPSYLKPFKYQTKEKDGVSMISECNDYAKGVEIHNKLFDNKLYAGTTGQTKDNAMKTGRGKSLSVLRFDEIGFSKYNWLAYASAQPAHAESAAVAERMGAPHNVVMTSTPPDATTKEGEWLYKLLFEESPPFTLKLFDLSKAQIKEYMKNAGSKDIIFCSFAYNELGFTQQWLNERLRGMDRDKFDIEVMLKWKRILTRSPFSRRALELIEIYARNSEHHELFIDDIYRFVTYEDFDAKRMSRILIAVDIAGGGGENNDYSTMVGIDPETTKVLFTFRSNALDTEMFARLIIKFYRMYTPHAVLIIERNGIGKGVIDKVKYCDDIVDKLYYQTNLDRNDTYVLDSKQDMKKDKYGIYIDHNIREIMYKEILNTRVNRYKTYFNSPDIVRELMSVTITNSGRYDHLPGYHDDLLFAYMTCLYVLYKDMNLDAKFAIHVPAILDDEAKSYNSPDAFAKRESTFKELTPEEKKLEFMKAMAMNTDSNITSKDVGYRTLEDEMYRRDVESARFVSNFTSHNTNRNEDEDEEIEVGANDQRMARFAQRVNSLMPRAKFNF